MPRRRPGPSSAVLATGSAARSRCLRARTRTEPGAQAPDRDQAQCLGDDPTADLGPSVLAFAERDRHLCDGQSEVPGSVRELNLEGVSVRSDGCGHDGLQGLAPVDAEAARGIVTSEK